MYPLSRRELLQKSGLGFGSMALTYLLDSQPLLGAEPALSEPGHDLKPRPSQFQAQAKAVIQLMQNGGPSQMDLFDPKPELTKRDGQDHPGQLEIHFDKQAGKLLKSPFEFNAAGQSGMVLSELLPRTAGIADEIAAGTTAISSP